jgi:hypothetical protein
VKTQAVKIQVQRMCKANRNRERPGLGVEFDEARVRHASHDAPDWRNPAWQHADARVAEW